MGFWDHTLQFRETLLRENPHPNLEEALRAVKFLRTTLEPHWVEQESPHHPIASRLNFSSYENNLWLGQLARKLSVLEAVDGAVNVIPKLADPKLYPSVRFEVEVAAALLSGGFRVQFIPPKQSGPSADILARIGESEFMVEVTTLNRSEIEEKTMGLVSWITYQGFVSGMIAGGRVNGMLYSKSQDTEARERITAGVERARANHDVEHIMIPGFVNMWVAPSSMVDQMPSGARGIFEFTNPPEPDLQLRLARKVKDKMSQISREGTDSFLIVYSDLVGWQGLEELLSKPSSEIEVVINTVPSLMGLSLAAFAGILSTPENRLPRSKDSMILFISELGKQEPYGFLNWRNEFSNHPIPPGIFSAFQNYAANMEKLPSLPA
jgi:hypothetical protein